MCIDDMMMFRFLYGFSIEPYTIREARIHVRHVRDLLKSVDCSDAYTGVDCASLSFLNSITSGDVSGNLHKFCSMLSQLLWECCLYLCFISFSQGLS